MNKQEQISKIDFIAKKNGANLKVIDIEEQDGKMLITFSAEQRVDFRDLVKELASVFKSRIELKQIGARDQAKQVGAIGCCGRECCCKKYLKEFDNVSIKMAKNQNLALNPNRINGMCGRLLCCLNYENDHYSKAIAKMPKYGTEVITPDGKGMACESNLLKEEVTVRFGSGSDVVVKKFAIGQIKAKQFNKKD